MVNKVILVGRVGRDAEVRATQSGMPVASFSLATYEKWNDKATGEKRERTEWHNIRSWGKLAEICGNHVKKGMLIFVEGSISYSEYEDKEGAKRNRTEIVADVVRFLSGPTAHAQHPEAAPAASGDDQDIPF